MKQKTRSGVKNVKTADKEGYNTGMEVKVSFDKGTKPPVKKPSAFIVHGGNKYTFRYKKDYGQAQKRASTKKRKFIF